MKEKGVVGWVDIATKELLNNILFIIFPLLFVQIIYSPARTKMFEKIRIWLIPLLPASSIILCMLYPIADLHAFDFRTIPIIIAGLYGGFRLSFILFGIYMVFQLFFVTGFDYFLSFMFNLIFFSFVPLFSKRFIQATITMKLIISIGMAFAASILNLLFVQWRLGEMIDDGLAAEFIAGHMMVMIIVVLLIEMIVQNIFLEQRLIKAEKVEVASHLAASISHEIRNPLTASKGFMQLLYEDVPKSRHEYLNIAIQELNQAESVIRNYLTFAKPSLERPEAISVTDIVETVIGIAEPLAAEHEVKINYHQANLSIHVLGDRIRLQQALLNIVKNGIEAMPNGGVLTIDLQMKDSVVTIEVKDTGIGMSTEQMNRLGEPYFSTKEKGTGLGMMVTYRIIQTMQGQIIVTSEKQKGTSFTVEIPVHERAS